MNPSFSSTLVRPWFIPVVFAALPGLATAADVVKANSAVALNDPASWVGGVLPGATDMAVFDQTVAAATLFGQTGGDLTLYGIRVTNPQSLNVSSGYSVSPSTILTPFSYLGTFYLGAGGFDLSNAVAVSASQNNTFFSFSSPMQLTANQTWNIADLVAARDLSIGGSTFAGTPRRTMPLNFGGYTVTKTGAGNVGILFDRFISNGTIEIQQGNVTFGNAQNVATNTNIIQDVDSTFVVKVFSGARVTVAQAPTTGAGKTNWNAALTLQGGMLHLNGGGYTGNLDLAGTLQTSPATTSSILYDSTASTTTFPTVLPVISAPISGSGNLDVLVSTPRFNDRVTLAGDNSGFSGTLALAATSGNRTLALSGSVSGSAAATWRVDAGNTLELASANVNLGTLNGEGTLRGAGGPSNANVGSGNFSGAITEGLGAQLSLFKNTTGTLVLSGPGDYTGGLILQAGTVRIDGNQSAATGSVLMATSATIGGSGAYGGDVDLVGTLAPGASIGAFRIGGVLTMQPSSSYIWDVTDWTGQPGSGVDTVHAGTLAINATSGAPVIVQINPQSLTNYTNTNKLFPLVMTNNPITGFASDKFAVQAPGSITGTWSVVLSTDGTDLYLRYTGPGGDPFDAWTNTFASLTNPSDKLRLVDPDKDGRYNLLEYALGASPASGVGAYHFGNAEATGPVLTLGVRNGAYFSLSNGAQVAVSDSVTYRIEGSTDLASWTQQVEEVVPNGGFSAGLPSLPNGWSYRSFRIAGGVTPRGFLRAVAE